MGALEFLQFFLQEIVTLSEIFAVPDKICAILRLQGQLNHNAFQAFQKINKSATV